MNSEQEINAAAFHCCNYTKLHDSEVYVSGFEDGVAWRDSRQPSSAPSGEVMSLEECLDHVAHHHNTKDWDRVLYEFDMCMRIGIAADHTLDNLYREAAELYAQQFKDKAAALEQELNVIKPILIYLVGKLDLKPDDLNNFDKAMIKRAEEALQQTDNDKTE